MKLISKNHSVQIPDIHIAWRYEVIWTIWVLHTEIMSQSPHRTFPISEDTTSEIQMYHWWKGIWIMIDRLVR